MEHLSGAKNTVADFLSRYPYKVKYKDTGSQTAPVEPVKPLQESSPGSKRKVDHIEMVRIVTAVCIAHTTKFPMQISLPTTVVQQTKSPPQPVSAGTKVDKPRGKDPHEVQSNKRIKPRTAS